MENSPVVTVNNGEDGAPPSVAGNPKTVRFQCGLLRETETFAEEDLQDVSLAALLDYVDEMLNVKFPEHPYGDLAEKLLLLRHTSNNSLVPLRDKENIRDGDIIEIVLSADSKQEFDDTICPHILTVHTYTGGIFCDYCGELLFGLLKQGLKCQGCDKNFHKKCAYHIPNNCTRLGTAEGVANSVTPRPPQQVWSGRPLWIDRTLKARPQVPHTFFSLTCKKPTACSHCKKMLKGVFRQGLKCKDCKIVIHKRCARELGNNCLGEVPSLSRVDSGEWSNATRGVIANEHLLSSEEISSLSTGSVGGASVGSDGTREGAGSGEPGEQREESPASARQEQDHYEPPVSPSEFPGSTMDAIAEEPSGEDTTSNEGSEHNVAEPHDSSDNIKLQRVTGVSFRHTKAPPASILKEGWMVHYTNKSDVRMKFYWRLDTKCLTLYKSDTGSHYHIEIALADMLAVDQMVTPELYPLTPPHVFEIVTSAMTYYVGVDMTGALSSDLKPSVPIDSGAINLLGDVSHMTLPELEEMGMGLNVGVQWEEALHAALMPVTPQCSMGSLAEIGRGPSFRNRRGSMKGSLRGSFHGNRGNSFRGGSIRGRRGSKRGSFRVPKPGMNPGKVSPSNLIKPKVETRLDISLFYQVFPEEILGSGQFGTVYGGQNRHTAKPVAVKIIDKLRFPHKHESQLRTEVTILQNLSHPGIIHLEHMFETPERIYVVMEKMNGDMLEMILSSPNSKLDERITKFMIYQILTALQYLHKKDVVHCDLKPENVLLTSENGMPQTKLCDFGFARMIGEKSFRKSIVGTPAYLAPEVLKNEGYNRSLDLWSVGVIIYVSLSGTFPFNEDEEISDQIQNAAFMYPPDPWGSISKEAIDLINKLLQVSRRNRFKTTQAMNHHWLRDLQLREDLCNLEGMLGMRYLTHDAEDSFWEAQGAKPHPLAAREAERREAERRPPPVHSYQNVTIPISGPAQLNGPSSVPGDGVATTNGTGDPQGAGLVPPSGGVDRRYASSSTLRSSNGSTPTSSRRSTIEMSDEEIVMSEEHAKRVGYKVSTV